MDPSGVRTMGEANPLLDRVLGRHVLDYAELSSTPNEFRAFAQAVTHMMKTQPNYSALDLSRIGVPVQIVHAAHDEFIKPEHAAYLARSILKSSLVTLPGVSHFAPLQRCEQFNRAMLDFLQATTARDRP